METLWKYTLQGNFTNKNAGFSMWCFGTSNGKEYFIKQFLAPKYPANDTESSPDRIAKRIAQCETFERRRRKLYETLFRLSDGNDVRILSFFRVASRYYIATEKIDALPWTVEDVAQQSEPEKRRLCAVIAHAVAALHAGGMVHSDIKHDNILFTRTETGAVTAKIIDFDGGFLEEDPPTAEEGVTGDANYFSPEVCARSYGEQRPLTCKLDVFALGVLFHQYFSGRLPWFEPEIASCPGEFVLQGNALPIEESVPEDIAPLLRQMLAEDPAARPTAQEVFLALRSSVKSDDEPAAFCIMCGRPLFAGEKLCEECIAELLRRARPDDSERTSPFYRPGDL